MVASSIILAFGKKYFHNLSTDKETFNQKACYCCLLAEWGLIKDISIIREKMITFAS
jgi:hypothetical protein